MQVFHIRLGNPVTQGLILRALTCGLVRFVPDPVGWVDQVCEMPGMPWGRRRGELLL
jgi:hypothetical protein